MKYELKLHRITFGTLAIVLIVFVTFLLHIRPSLADERLEVIASLLVVVVVAAALASMGMIEGTMAFQFGTTHKRELLSYLLLGVLSLASGLYLALSETASLQAISLVAAPYALLFGLGELRIAQHFERHPQYRKGLVLCGLIEIALGFALVAGSRLSSEGAATLLGYVAALSILQLLPLLFYSPKVVSQQIKTH